MSFDLRNFRNLKIRNKIALGFVLILLSSLGAIFCISVAVSYRIASQTKLLTDETYPNLEKIGMVENRFNQFREESSEAMHLKTRSLFSQAKRTGALLKNTLLRVLKVEVPEDSSTDLDKIHRLFSLYSQKVESLTRRAGGGAAAKTPAPAPQALNALASTINTELQTAKARQRDVFEDTLAEIDLLGYSFVWMLVVIAVMGLGVSIFLAFVISGLIVRPVQVLEQKMREIVDNSDYSKRIEVQSTDEVGSLSGTFNQLIATLQERGERLRRIQGNLEAVLRSTPAGILMVDRDQTVRYVNDKLTQMFGLDPKAVLDRPRDSAFLPHLLNSIEEPHRFLERDKEPPQAAFEEDIVLRRPSYRIYRRFRGPVQDAVHGFVGQIEVYTDETLQRESSQTDFLANIAFSFAEPIITVDAHDLVIRTWNQPAEALLGWRAEEAIGKTLSEMIRTPGDRAVVESPPGLSADTKIEHELDILDKNGTSVPVHFILTSLRERSGHRLGLMCVLRDLRRFRELQQQVLQSGKMAAVGNLATGVAHDVNNPLMGILGITLELLADPTWSPEKRAELELIRKETQRCQRIVKNLLEFSHVRKMQREPVPVGELLDKTLEPLEKALAAAGVRVVRGYPLPGPRILGDRFYLQRIFTNLINNAVFAMQGRAGATLGLGAAVSGAGCAITVQDNGVGISEEDLPKIFDPFFTTKFTGRGLGLAATLGIVKGHYGAIEVESAPQQGATFRVYLPVAKTAEAKTA